MVIICVSDTNDSNAVQKEVCNILYLLKAQVKDLLRIICVLILKLITYYFNFTII